MRSPCLGLGGLVTQVGEVVHRAHPAAGRADSDLQPAQPDHHHWLSSPSSSSSSACGRLALDIEQFRTISRPPPARKQSVHECGGLCSCSSAHEPARVRARSGVDRIAWKEGRRGMRSAPPARGVLDSALHWLRSSLMKPPCETTNTRRPPPPPPPRPTPPDTPSQHTSSYKTPRLVC